MRYECIKMIKNIIMIFLMFGVMVANTYAAPVTVKKQQIVGLIDRQNTSWINQNDGTPQFTMDNVNQFPGVFSGVVLNTSWAALQPTPYGPLDVSTIKNALKQIAAYNKQHPTRPLAVKLRVWAGANAPLWAKSLGGSPITIYRNKVGNCTGAPTCALTVGRFWDVNGQYVQAWRAFQVKLAKIYDDAPLIHQIAVTSCTQQTDEPFVPTTDNTAKANLRAAGYTDAAQQVCLKNAALVDFAPWKKTLIDFSFNPFFYMDANATGQNMQVTEDVMDSCISTLGQRCILDNQSVGTTGQTIHIPIFQAIWSRGSQGAPINLQTAGPIGMGNNPQQTPDTQLWENTFTMAHDIGAKGLEVWSEPQYGGVDKMSMTQLCSLLYILLPGNLPTPPCEVDNS